MRFLLSSWYGWRAGILIGRARKARERSLELNEQAEYFAKLSQFYDGQITREEAERFAPKKRS